MSLNSIIICCEIHGKVNFRGKIVHDMVSGHLLKIGISLLLLTEGILSHIQYSAFVTSKSPTPLDCVALPLQILKVVIEGAFIFRKILHLLEHLFYQCDFGKNHSKFNNLFEEHWHLWL